MILPTVCCHLKPNKDVDTGPIKINCRVITNHVGGLHKHPNSNTFINLCFCKACFSDTSCFIGCARATKPNQPEDNRASLQSHRVIKAVIKGKQWKTNTAGHSCLRYCSLGFIAFMKQPCHSFSIFAYNHLYCAVSYVQLVK